MAGNQYLPIIQQAAARYGVPPQLLYEIIQHESSFNSNATSRDKNGNPIAVGIAQFTEPTARQYGLVGDGFDYRTDPARSIDASARYLRDAFKRGAKNWAEAGAMYIGGFGVNLNKMGPNTRNYYNYMMKKQQAFEGNPNGAAVLAGGGQQGNFNPASLAPPPPGTAVAQPANLGGFTANNLAGAPQPSNGLPNMLASNPMPQAPMNLTGFNQEETAPPLDLTNNTRFNGWLLRG